MRPKSKQARRVKNTFASFIHVVNKILVNFEDIKLELEERIISLSKETIQKIDEEVKLSEEKANAEESVTCYTEKKPDFVQYFQGETPLLERKRMQTFEEKNASKLKFIDKQIDEEKGVMRSLVGLQRSIRLNPIEKLNITCEVLTKEEFETRKVNSFIRSSPSFLQSISETSQSLFKMITKPSEQTTEQFNDRLASLFFGIKDLYRKEATFRGVMYSVCAALSSENQNSSILGFERSFVSKQGCHIKNIQIDGSIGVGKTVVIMEFKKHDKNGRPDPLACILGRNYNGKIKISSDFDKAFFLGITFKGDSYLRRGKRYVLTEIYEGIIENNQAMLGRKGKALNFSAMNQNDLSKELQSLNRPKPN